MPDIYSEINKMEAVCFAQGCHYLLDVKFKDFSMTFQELFKEIQDLLYQLKLERFTHCFQNKLYYSALLIWLILIMKNNQ